MRRLTVIIVAWALVVALAACDDGGSGSSAPDQPTSSTTAAGSATTTTTPNCEPGTGSTAAQQGGSASGAQYLVAVAAQGGLCDDTITFTFQDSVPGFQVGYDTGPITNSAGQEVRPPGTAFLKMRFEPAWIVDLNQPGTPLTYTGPRVITPVGTSVVRQVAMYDASEAVVGWVAGIDGNRPFQLSISAHQLTVIVDRA